MRRARQSGAKAQRRRDRNAGAPFAPDCRAETQGAPRRRSDVGGEAPPAKQSAATHADDPWARGSGRLTHRGGRLEKPRVKQTTQSDAQTWVIGMGGRALRGGPRVAQRRWNGAKRSERQIRLRMRGVQPRESGVRP